MIGEYMRMQALGEGRVASAYGRSVFPQQMAHGARLHLGTLVAVRGFEDLNFQGLTC